MATSRSISNGAQNLSVGTLSPLPGTAGIYFNGLTTCAFNGVTTAPTAAGLPSSNSTDSFTISRGTSAIRLAPSELAFGPHCTASGAGAVSAGVSCAATGAGSVASGQDATASGTSALAIAAGGLATAAGNQSVAVGTEHQVTGTGAIAVGNSAVLQANYAIALGRSTVPVTYTDAVAIGLGATPLGPQTVAFGGNATIHETASGHRFKYVPVALTTNPTVADIMGGLLTYNGVSDVIAVLRPAAQFAAAMGVSATIGSSVHCTVVNQSAFAIIFVTDLDTNWTLADSTNHTIAANTTRELTIIKTGNDPVTCAFYM